MKKSDDILNLTVYERIKRELNVAAWAFECQFMDVSTSVIETPRLHSKGRYMAGIYYITSNLEMLNLQEYIKHYTERFENTSNTILLKNELTEIYKKTIDILEYYNNNLTSNSKIVKEFHDKKPSKFKENQAYLKEHKGIIVTHDLYPQNIVFGLDFDTYEAKWTHSAYNYPITHDTLILFCEKLIDFIEKFDISENDTSDNIKQSKIPAKYYALYHWLLIDLGIEKPFELNEDGKFAKSKIENFARERYDKISSQMFYKAFIDIDITDKNTIANSFGSGYKKNVIDISDNNSKIITLLKSFPN